MGCSNSRLDREDELPAGLRPFKERIGEMKRRRRERNVSSIQSTTELLKCEEMSDDEDSSHGGEIGREMRREWRLGAVDENGDELPGSPSFRVYCSPAAAEAVKAVAAESVKAAEAPAAESVKAAEGKGSNDDSANGAQKTEEKPNKEKEEKTNEKTNENMEEKAKENNHGREESNESMPSSEDLEVKPLKNNKGRRFRKLTKGSSRVKGFFTSRNCHSSHPTVSAQANSTSANPFA